jgi:hypothetical protein
MLDINILLPAKSRYNIPPNMNKFITEKLAESGMIYKDDILHESYTAIDNFLSNISNIIAQYQLPYTYNSDITTYVKNIIKYQDPNKEDDAINTEYLNILNGELEECIKSNQSLTYPTFKTIEDYKKLPHNHALYGCINNGLKTYIYNNKELLIKKGHNIFRDLNMNIFNFGKLIDKKLINISYPYDDNFIKYREIITRLMYNNEFTDLYTDYDELEKRIKAHNDPPKEYQKLNIDNRDAISGISTIIRKLYVNINKNLINTGIPIPDNDIKALTSKHMQDDIKNIKKMREYIDELKDDIAKGQLIALYNSILFYKFYNFTIFSGSLTIISNNPNAICIYISQDSINFGHFSTVRGLIDLRKYIGPLNKTEIPQLVQIINNYMIREI